MRPAQLRPLPERLRNGPAADSFFSPLELYYRAEDILRAWRVILPAPSTIWQVVASLTSRSRDDVYARISKGIPPDVREAIDKLLAAPEGSRSPFYHLKAYPPEATGIVITAYLDHYRTVRDSGVENIHLSGVGHQVVVHLADVARRFDAWSLRRFSDEKCYALMACFLLETEKTILDHLVALHDQYVLKRARECRNGVDKRLHRLRQSYKRSLEMVLAAVGKLVDPERSREITVGAFLCEVNEEALRQAAAICTEVDRLQQRGFADAIRARYRGFRTYLPGFFELPFTADRGKTGLLEGIDLVRQLDRGEVKRLPPDLPMSFVGEELKPALLDKNGCVDRGTWELALAFAPRDALRSGDIYLPRSRRHLAFSSLVYDSEQWAREQDTSYTELELPKDPDVLFDRLRAEDDAAAKNAERHFAKDQFAWIENGELKIVRPGTCWMGGFHSMTEVIFIVEEAPEGGYLARALGEAIFAEADTLAELHELVRDAVQCHFEEKERPRMIRLHFVRDEVIAV